ncbi:MAG: hypothetical protein BMS9Abin04_413 [Planctomycetia bacterium]|nr:MAG: hypothetical protein BMS9Abin04_413 [Planctomycetia bacterium]
MDARDFLYLIRDIRVIRGWSFHSEIVYKDESYAIIGACFEVYNYLKATHFRLGLLVNFGQHPQLQYERIVN